MKVYILGDAKANKALQVKHLSLHTHTVETLCFVPKKAILSKQIYDRNLPLFINARSPVYRTRPVITLSARTNESMILYNFYKGEEKCL